jgi:peptidoglycan/xylan/chitin deacetylase (PgdA/CDA1 family)
LAVPPKLFEHQLDWLKRRRLVLPLSEFAHLHTYGRLPKKAVAITFDDGYACNAVVAAPILLKYGLPATIFLATGFVSSPEEFWWDALERIIATTVAQRLTVIMNEKSWGVPLGDRDSLSLNSKWRVTDGAKSTRQAAYAALWKLLRLMPDYQRRQIMHDLHSQARIDTSARPSHRIMTASEAAELAKVSAIDIGAHSVTHPVLNELPLSAQKMEVEKSREACLKLCGKIPSAFAYPYGAYDQDVIGVVKAAGFKIACTSDAFSVTSHCVLDALPRLSVAHWSWRALRYSMRALQKK